MAEQAANAIIGGNLDEAQEPPNQRAPETFDQGQRQQTDEDDYHDIYEQVTTQLSTIKSLNLDLTEEDKRKSNDPMERYEQIKFFTRLVNNGQNLVINAKDRKILDDVENSKANALLNPPARRCGRAASAAAGAVAGEDTDS